MLEWSEPALATVPARLSPAARPSSPPRAAERILLVGADFITRISDYADRRIAPRPIVLGCAGFAWGGARDA